MHQKIYDKNTAIATNKINVNNSKIVKQDKKPKWEISSDWKARTEGASQNKFMANFLYLKTAIRIRFFLDKNSILK